MINTTKQLDLQNCTNIINQHKNEFETYFSFLVESNKVVNLTAITQHEDVFVKHFLDSLLAIDCIEANSKVVDVGTGAGLPGVVLKIAKPSIDLTLVDSLNKRINFLNELCKKLNLKSQNVHARAEDFAIKNKAKFDVAVARAVAKCNTLAEYLLPLVKVGGKVILYKSGSYAEELEQAKNAINILGGKVKEIKTCTLPNNAGERALIVIEKVKPTPPQYPRGQNKPKLNPL